MLPATTDPDRLLTWLTATAVAAAGLSVVAAFALGPMSPWWALLLWVVAIALIVVRYRGERRRIRRICSLLLVPVAAALWVMGVGPLLIPLQLVALVILVRDWSVRAGVIAWLALTVFSITLYLFIGFDGVAALVEATGVATLLAFGLVFAIVMQRLVEAQARDRDAMRILDAANARLRHNLAVEKELVLADERARMSRELHDGLGHRLTLVSMRLELAERLADKQPDASRQAVRESRGLVVESIDATRMWVRALSPTGERGLTGRAAMEAIADSFRTTGLTVDLQGDGDPAQLGEAAQLVGYRIVQEGLTNALRHSDARRVTVELTDARLPSGEPALAVRVSNDLPAPDSEDPNPVVIPGGFGLRSLAERADGVGGELTAGVQGDVFVLHALLPKERHD